MINELRHNNRLVVAQRHKRGANDDLWIRLSLEIRHSTRYTSGIRRKVRNGSVLTGVTLLHLVMYRHDIVISHSVPRILLSNDIHTFLLTFFKYFFSLLRKNNHTKNLINNH